MIQFGYVETQEALIFICFDMLSVCRAVGKFQHSILSVEIESKSLKDLDKLLNEVVVNVQSDAS